MSIEDCVICGSVNQEYEMQVWEDREPKNIRVEARRCSICGCYNITREMVIKINGFLEADRMNLSGIVNETCRGDQRTLYSENPVNILSEQDVERLLKSPLIPKSVNEKAEKLLKHLIEASDFPGQPKTYDPDSLNLQAVCYATSNSEVGFYIDYLIENEWIKGDRGGSGGDIARNVVITIPGYVKAEELERRRKNLSQGFVAMEFGENEDCGLGLQSRR